jgi:hypothetical protein
VACRRMRSAAVPRALAALTAGCAGARAAVPSLDSAGFALHEGLFARQGLHQQDQQLADISRAAAERAMEAPLLPPPGLTPDIAALIWLDSYPSGRAGVGEDPAYRRRNAAVPRSPRFNVTSMLSGYP